MTALEELRENAQPLPGRWRRVLVMLAIVCGVLLIVPSGILAWRLHATSSFLAADQAADAQRDQALQELYDACMEASDCDVGDVPSPEELEESAPDLDDAALPVEPETVVVQERLSASELEVIADEAIARCVESGECVGEEGQPAPPTDPAVIAALIGDYCRSEGACAPTTAEVYQAVAFVCADAACQGDPGRPPTAEEIAAATASCFASGACAAREGPQGPQGVPGVQGASVVDVVCQPNTDGLLTLQFVIADPATGTSSVADSGAACTPATIPPTSEPTPEPTPTDPGIDVPVPSLDP